MIGRLCSAIVALLAWSSPGIAARYIWAWERPELLQTLPPEIGIAAVAGFIRVRGDAVVIRRSRRFPVLMPEGRPAPIAVIHVEIDQNQPLLWNDSLAAQVIGLALSFAGPAARVQLDMEVRTSQRVALLDVLQGLRAGLRPNTRLSMTALASWCDTESWLDRAPVDEIVPMLFRMGRGGARLQAKLAAGGDFGFERCRHAVGIALDAPVVVPPGRDVYIFNPRAWDPVAIASLGPG